MKLSSDFILKIIPPVNISSVKVDVGNILVQPKDKTVQGQFLLLKVNKVLLGDAGKLEKLEVSVPLKEWSLNDTSTIISNFKDGPVRVRHIEFYLSVAYINKLLKYKELLDIKEIEEVHVNVKDGKLYVTGKAKKIVTVSFLVIINVKALDKGRKVKVDVEKVKILNFLPVPGFGLSWVLDFISKKLNFNFIQKERNSFIVNLTKIAPKNIIFNFNIQMDDKKNQIVIYGNEEPAAITCQN